MIVNARPAVDKAGFVYRLKGLRAAGLAGQALYRPCTDVGQKTVEPGKRVFCTSDAVDMQGFFHSAVIDGELLLSCVKDFRAIGSLEMDDAAYGRGRLWVKTGTLLPCGAAGCSFFL